jgi:hypothetical protein
MTKEPTKRGGRTKPPEGETPNQRFHRVGGRRVAEVKNAIKLFGQLANPKQYEWHPVQVKAIFKALRDQLDAAEKSFENPTTPGATVAEDLSKYMPAE